MKTKVLQVFYGADALPYKDKERTVHFPIVGNAIQNANNTTQIKFYFDRLVEENEQTTFVAVSKIPNGKIGSKILETYDDEELGEQYALLDLDSFYTQYKGDVFISLQGYQGGVRVEQDEQGIYQIYGTPVIAATGSIKLAINYAPSFVGSGETENVTLQQVLGELSTKLGVRQETLHVEELPTVGNPDVWYVINDDEDDPNKQNIYIWNETTQSYIWVGDNTLDLGDYYTKEQGETFEGNVNEALGEYDDRIESVENELSSVASGSPKGVYSTLADLQSAYPTGTDGIYVVQANGHWYYWNGSQWSDGGVYLSTGDAVSYNSFAPTENYSKELKDTFVGSGFGVKEDLVKLSYCSISIDGNTVNLTKTEGAGGWCGFSKYGNLEIKANNIVPPEYLVINENDSYFLAFSNNSSFFGKLVALSKTYEGDFVFTTNAVISGSFIADANMKLVIEENGVKVYRNNVLLGTITYNDTIKTTFATQGFDWNKYVTGLSFSQSQGSMSFDTNNISIDLKILEKNYDNVKLISKIDNYTTELKHNLPDTGLGIQEDLINKINCDASISGNNVTLTNDETETNAWRGITKNGNLATKDLEYIVINESDTHFLALANNDGNFGKLVSLSKTVFEDFIFTTNAVISGSFVNNAEIKLILGKDGGISVYQNNTLLGNIVYNDTIKQTYTTQGFDWTKYVTGAVYASNQSPLTFKTNNLVVDLEKINNSVLPNIKLYGIGDSIMEYGYFLEYLEEDFGVSYVNYGISATGFATNSNPYYSRVASMSSTAPDIILIEGGTNDFGQSVPLANVESGIVSLITNLNTKYPNTPILVMLPTQRNYTGGAQGETTGMTNSLGITLEQYVDTIKNKFNEYGIKCIDLYRESGLNMLNVANLTYDGLHWKQTFHRRIATIVHSYLITYWKNLN